MVDFRPLLFLNALALMLLVTAGFASIRQDMPSPELAETSTAEAVAEVSETVPADKPEETGQPDADTPAAQEMAEAAPESDDRVTEVEKTPKNEVAEAEPALEPFTVDPLPEDPEMLAMVEPVSAMDAEPEAAAKPEPEPEPTTGKLTLRSNVVGDSVTINGRNYGTTRLDVELEPGTYDVTISKDGYKSWSDNISLQAGSNLTLVGELEEYTRVDYRNGTWIGGVKTGDGTYEDSDGLRYEGHFVDGQFHGNGTAWYPDGSRYEGEWQDGQRSGEGQYRDADGSAYTGQFREGEFNGEGTLTRANGDILTGNWVNGRLNGHGTLTTIDGKLYVGNFRNDRFHGEGTLTFPDGRNYEGEFSNGEFHGKGTEVFADGKKYEGQYIEGKFHGRGLLLNPNGSSIEATFRHGEPYGQVRLTTAAGEVFTARTSEPGVCYREKSYRATQCPQLEGW